MELVNHQMNIMAHILSNAFELNYRMNICKLSNE